MEERRIRSPAMDSKLMLLWYFGVVTVVKLLLMPSYRSTDFEVHRSWLALTRSLPLSQWYLDETSPWTLDYPPFFAYFERLLSFFAYLVDPTIVDLHEGLNYGADSVIYFQRITVILSDLCLLYGVYRLSRGLDAVKRNLMWVLVVCSPMLLIVDHIHFQYNGFLLGWLMLSISYLQEGRDLIGGFLFAVLLCFKHLFAVAAPLFFVYLLRHYCWSGLLRGFGRLSLLGSVVVAVFAAAYGPFVYGGQPSQLLTWEDYLIDASQVLHCYQLTFMLLFAFVIQQVIRRMFPFGRGLCHAYWAPNFWVFYIILDKVLAILLKRSGFTIAAPAASFTGGLVGDSSSFAVLPQITPVVTFALVLLALSPCLIKAWRDPQPGQVARWIAYAYTCGFLFGWHVHEKASLQFIIPLAIVAIQSSQDARHYFIVSIVSCYSLFPLLYEAREYPVKVLLLLLHSLLMELSFSAQYPSMENAVHGLRHEQRLKEKAPGGGEAIGRQKGFAVGGVGKSYLLGLVMLEVWCQFLHRYLLGNKLPFLPLMLISTYCAIGIMYSWIWQLGFIIGAS